MIQVKPSPSHRIIDNVFFKYSQSLKLLNTNDYNNKQLYFKFILYEAAREIAQIYEMRFEHEFDEENIKYTDPYSYYVKDRIDLIIQGDIQLVIQTLIDVPNNTKDAIDHLLGESLKLSFENGDKYIFWICNDLVYQTYLNNYGNEYIFKTDDLINSRNFKITTKYTKDNFKVIIKMDAVTIDNNKKLVSLQIQ